MGTGGEDRRLPGTTSGLSRVREPPCSSPAAMLSQLTTEEEPHDDDDEVQHKRSDRCSFTTTKVYVE